MKKENKNKKEELDDKVEMENFFDVFLRNYRNVPAFKSLVKLSGYILLIIIFVLVASTAPKSANNSKSDNDKTTTKAVEKNISYLEMLDDVINSDKGVNIEIVNYDKKFLIEGELTSGVLSGYYTTDVTTKRFIIEEGKTYELNLDERVENNNLFVNLDLTFIDQKSLIESIKKNPGTKEVLDKEIQYNYEITSNDKKYNLKSHVKDDKIYQIEVVGDSVEYNISYK